jgi:dihydrofolate reductase
LKISLVAAVARNGVIGNAGGLPWRLSSDLRRFKAYTMGKPIIMGRKTFESIGKPLPGRANIVISRSDSWTANGIYRAESIDSALAMASEFAGTEGTDEICVIGGGEIYAQTLPYADRLHITFVDAKPEGDTKFPAIDPKQWDIVETESVPVSDRDSAATEFVLYERKANKNMKSDAD